MSLTPLGEAPSRFGHEYERPSVWIESAPHSGNFQPAPFLVEEWRCIFGANDRIPTCQIAIALARNLDLTVPPGSGDLARPLRDWQLFDGTVVYKNAEEVFGGGRRIQVRTNRPEPADDWCLFEGFADKLQKGWSGTNSDKPRWFTMYCTNVAIAADREPNQFFIGQWRRTRRAELELLEDEADQDVEVTNECVRVTALPPVFNPGGRPNQDARVLQFGDDPPDPIFDHTVYVFTDAVEERVQTAAKHWNVARILRYLQWAAVQPALSIPTDLARPYDQVGVSSTEDLGLLQWTTYQLAHTRAQYDSSSGEGPAEIGPNLDELVSPYLDRYDEGSPDDPQEQAMLRQPADLSIEGMTTLEAFAYVCDQAGVLFHVEHDQDRQGRCWTYLRFTVRGDRCSGGSVPGGHDDMGIPSGDGSSNPPGLRLRDAGTHCTARGVFLYVKADWDTSTAPDEPAGAETAADVAFRADVQTEGVIVEDIAQQRSRVLVVGAPTQYEGTWVIPLGDPDEDEDEERIAKGSLLPGWTPNSDWDVDPGEEDDEEDTAAEIIAIAFAATSAWQARYGRTDNTFEFMRDGRYWVLNEDGAFKALTADESPLYKRDHGVWADEEVWEPYAFRSHGGIFELEERGDNQWSVRKRRFLPLNSVRAHGALVDPLVWISFDAGTTWWPGGRLQVEASFDAERCAVLIRNPDLNLITNPADSAETYVTQYIRNQLRIRVTANVEGDDALLAWSPAVPGSNVNWIDVVLRGEKLPRMLRFEPGSTAEPASATNVLITNTTFRDRFAGDNRDAQAEALRLAARMAEELAVARFTGQCVIPWLWRNNKGPVTGYRIGDEVLGLVSGTEATRWSFTPGREPEDPAARIIGITFAYSEGEMSTTLQLEDRSMGLDDVIGAPGMSENRWWASARGGRR